MSVALAAAVIGAVVLLATALQASAATPTLVSITSADNYQSVTLTFSEPVYRLDSNGDPLAGDPPLAASDFTLSGGTISSVAQGANRTVWTVTFSSAVTPHTAVIGLVAGSVGNAEGAADLSAPVPFSGQHLAALASALQSLELISGETLALPFIQDWLSEDRSLADLVAGLSDLPTNTEAALLAHIANIPALQLSFSGNTATVSFDDTVLAGSINMSGSAGADEIDGNPLGLSVEGTVEVGVSLGGGLVFTASGADVTVAAGAAAPTITLTTNGDMAASGRLGIVDITATAGAVLDATVAVDTLSPLAVSVSGSASLALTEVTVSGTSLSAFVGSPLLKMSWPDLGALFVCADGSAPQEADGLLFCTEATTTVPDQGGGTKVGCADGADPVDGVCRVVPDDNIDLDTPLAGGLQPFTRATFQDVLAGIAWFTAWLTEAEGHAALGADLPIVGSSIAELTQIANVISGPVLALSELASLVAVVDDSGGLSAQQLTQVCEMSESALDVEIDKYAALLGITGDELDDLRTYLQEARVLCAGLLSNAVITGDEIEFTLAIAPKTFDPFPNGVPELDLGLGSDLEGVSLSATSGEWTTAQATAGFSFTFGIKLGPSSGLGIPDSSDVGVPNVAHRVYIKSGDIATAGLDISGTGIGVDARLGFLDFNVLGSVAFNPSATLGLKDPTSAGPKADGKIDLYELAVAADTANLASLLTLAVNGDIDASFSLTNPVIFPSARTLEVKGPVSALGNAPGQVFAFGAPGATTPNAININHNLGDALNLKEITPAQALRMIAEIADQIGAMAGADALNTTIPFVDVSFQDAVDFSRDFARIAERIEERNPQDISALQAALNDALAQAGMPSTVSVGVTGTELTVSLDASKSVTKTYPFSFAFPGFNFAPADGGASIEATASVEFNPTIGIKFAGSSLDDRIFLRTAGVNFSLVVDANAFGTVYLGPVQAGIQGTVKVGTTQNPANLGISLGSGDLTLGALKSAFGPGGTPGSLLQFTYGGPLVATLDVSAPLGSGKVNVSGDINDVVQGGTSALTITHDLDFDIKLDLETLVFGTVEVSRFVGRLLENSEVVTADLPLIGDDLRTLTTIGADLNTAADSLATLWESAQGNEQAFLDGISAELNSVLCPDASCVEVRLLPPGPDTTIGNAEGIEIALKSEKSFTAGTTIDGGIDLAPVFDLDLALEPDLTLGYSLDLVLGLSVTDGFYIKAGDNAGDDVLQLYAGFNLTGINASANILSAITANITGGTAGITGNIGPNNNAGGFAVAINDKLTLRDLSNRNRSIDDIISARFEGEITATLPITTALEDFVRLSFPLHLNSKFSSGTGMETTLKLGDASDEIELDLTAIVDGVVKPIIEPLIKYNPLAQDAIVEVLQTQVPVLDESVEQLIGRLASASGYATEWEIIRFLINIGQLDPAQINGKLSLGWVAILPSFERHEPATPISEQPGYGQVLQLINALNPAAGASGAQGLDASVNGMSTDEPGTVTAANTSFSNMVSFPVLQDPMSALSLLTGGEQSDVVTFIEFAPPPLRVGPKIDWQATLFSLDVGFLEGDLKVALSGYLGLQLHTGFGYDSSGLRTGTPLDGFYLIDHPGFELSLGGRIAGSIDGRFAVAWGVASVRFHGSAGVGLEGGLDLFDDSIALPAHGRNNGRMNLNEIEIIADSYHPPISGVPASSYLCMFKLGVKFDAFLRFSGKAKLLGITVFNESYSNSWVFLDEELTCNIIEKAAHIDGRTLILNGGTYADRRFDGTGDLTEHFVLTQSGDTVTVVVTTHNSAGAQVNTITTSFNVADFDEIYAELGEGDDSVDIAQSITKPATIYGGPGDDTLLGGGGNDLLDGGPGNNVLKARWGNNTLRGGNDDDELWPGIGTDTLLGGGGKNTYKIPEGWGTATIADAAAEATIDFQTTSPVTGTASYYDGTVTSGDSKLRYEVSEVKTILGGAGADVFTVNRYAPNGFLLDGRGGLDIINVPFSGVERTITVTDSDGGANLNARGTASADRVFFRANGGAAPATGPVPAATDGFIALSTPNGAVDRVNYDDSITLVHFDGVGGKNEFILDDTAAPLEIDGGDGGSSFQVGQIFGNPRTPPHVPAGNEVRTRNVEARGPMSLGVSHPATLRGGNGNDLFTVFSNVADLKLEGVSGDNVFVLRAFILEGTVQAAGGDGNDLFEYVQNEKVEIDGGDGFNTMIMVGTELSDGFVIDEGDVVVCPQYLPSEIPAWAPVTRLPNPDSPDCGIDVVFSNIQRIVVHGLHGNNAFWVRSTSSDFSLELYGGTDGATFLVGDQGDLSGIEGPVLVDGESDPNFDATVPPPVVLPGEDATLPGTGLDVSYEDQDDRLVVDASAHIAGDTGTLTDSRIFGLLMGDDVTIKDRTFLGGVSYNTIDFVTVLLGDGDDNFAVESTHTYVADQGTEANPDEVAAVNLIKAGAGNDDILVRTIAGPTTVDLQDGDNVLRVGDEVQFGAAHPDAGSVLTGIADTLHVIGGAGADRVVLDASGTEVGADGLGERVDVEQGEVTRLSMPGKVTHTADIDVLDIFMTDGEDVANVRGTSADRTVIHGLDADDRTFVSDTAAYGRNAATPAFLPGTLADIGADLDIRSGDGANLLMVSDRDSDVALAGGEVDSDALRGFAGGTIFYDATGTFAQGITIWTGSGGDTISVVGTRSDGDPTTLDWHNRQDGGPRTVTTLNTMAGDDSIAVSLDRDTHGLFVLNAGDGDDTVDGSASTLGYIVFGGDGNDDITTGTGDDIVFGDHGRVEYCDGGTDAYHGGSADCGAHVVTLLGDHDVANINDGVARAPSRMYSIDTGAAGPTDGVAYNGWTPGFNNRINVGGGDDIAWGGAGSDLVRAESGHNALIGDHGEVWRFHPSELGGQRNVRSQAPFIDVDVLTGTIAYIVDVTHASRFGNDVIIGGADGDWIFGGSGEDIINGTAGNNIIWGGDGHDIIWGGIGDDRIYGGAGDNIIDLKMSNFSGLQTSVSDMAWWDLAWSIAPSVDTDSDAATTNGHDLIYGGHGRDILMADMGGAGPTPGDRLIDWNGSFNLYLVCDGGYGAGRVLRNSSPNTIEVLRQLAEADGAFNVRAKGLSGWDQLALAIDEHAGANRGQPHPNHPGNKATC